MIFQKTILPTLTALALLALAACQRKPTEPALFSQLDSTKTGVGFRNDLPENDKLNILEYLYYYNGAGVSAGDVNNDGLTDLYFVSNRASSRGKNKLYLNKGNFTFEDATEKAGLAGFADWQTGVTMADVNGDGWLDIYVCAVSNYKGLEGSNELYINNQDGTFTEKASEYGLDFQGFSTQAAFFDYDHDSDLDCYLVNHAVHTTRAYDKVSTRYLRDNSAGDVLYRNPGVGRERSVARERGVRRSENSALSTPKSALPTPKFINVSEEAGIYGAAMGFGLGIVVADFDNDGWEDIYVSNDFHEDDYLYLNQHDAAGRHTGFREAMREQMQHLSRFSMGCDAADVNNDGYPDLMTLDMYPADEKVDKSSGGEDPYDLFLYKLSYGYYYQFSRNCLQINHQGRKFSEVGAFAGVAATDWSWAPLLADFDNDGIKDLFISNGIVKRPNDLDYIKFLSADSVYYQITQMKTKKFDQPSLDMMPSGKVHNYLFRGTKGLQFEDKSLAWGFSQPSFSNGSAYADLDNDGDLDLVTNNINDPAGIFKNEGRQLFKNNFLKVKLQGSGANRFGVGAKVVLKSGGQMQVQQVMPTRGFLSSVEPGLTFGLGKTARIDSLFVLWNTGQMELRTNVKPNATITLRQADARLNAADFQWNPVTKPLFEDLTAKTVLPYRHRENVHFDFNRESLMPFLTSTEGPRLAEGDVNGDGLDDVYAVGAKHQAGTLVIQKAGGGFVPSRQPAFDKDSTMEAVDAAFFDADGDNDLDLYVVSGGNEFFNKMPELLDRLYLNDGRGGFESAPKGTLPPMFDNKSCVRPADFDRDGDIDLFVGGRVVGYAYGQSPRSYLLVNDKGNFSDQTDRLAPELRRAGMITDATWADTDGDKDLDLMVVGEWMEPKLFSNEKSRFSILNSQFSTSLKGLWHAVTAADFDGDGDVDFVLGNLGTNTKLRKNGNRSGLRMYVGDFDNSTSVEQIVAYKMVDSEGDEGWYPLASKDEMGKQLPGILNKKYTSYKKFAGQTVDDIFDKGQLKNGSMLEINTFESVYLENKGSNQFTVRPLPAEAQWSRVYSLLPTDADGDGKLDLLLGGNFYGVNPYQGRYDASYGLVLKGDGKGNFQPLSLSASGLLLEGEVRDLRTLRTKQGPLVLVGRNNLPMQVFRKK
ncbi:MAG: VCBS repeat-containing protein [Cytophagaceae bacterium]|nr:VCBS repeat-containing protein [Cytophagaceae bacterium]